MSRELGEAAPAPKPRIRAWAFWLLVLVVGALVHGPLLVQRPRPLSKSELALVATAERVLREGDEGFDYGAFFLRQEGAAGTPLEERWRALSATLADSPGTAGGTRLEGGVSNLLMVLFRDAHLDRYQREQASLSGFLVGDKAGGNCEAQTKLLVAAFGSARLSLPEGTELGVEIFQDHAQAVLVRRRERTVWNLLTGEQEMENKSDVYRPAILLSAYLRGLGRAPPVRDVSLLLLRAPKLPPSLQRSGLVPPAASFYTSSTLRLPASRARFAEGLPPEHTEVPFPLLHRAGEDRALATMDKDVTYRDAFVSANDPRLLFPIDRVGGSFGLVGSTLVFRSREDAERYQAAPSAEARRTLLLALAEAQIRTEIGTKPLELPSLAKLSDLPSPALDALLVRLQRIEWLLGLTEQAVDRSLRSAMVTTALELRIPELARTTRSLRQFSEEAGAEPELFFGRLGALDPLRRRRLISFFVPRLQSAHVRALSAALAEPGRVALSGRAPASPGGPSVGLAAPGPEMEIELLDGPGPVLAAGQGSASPSANVEAPREKTGGAEAALLLPVDAVEPLPVSAFLDLVLSGLFSSGSGEEAMPVLRRWDRAASEAVRLREGDCEDTLARLRHSVKRPFEEASQRIPPHLIEAEKRLARACQKPPAFSRLAALPKSLP